MSNVVETLDVVYQDDVLIAIHKPAGLLVHKSTIDKHATHNAMHVLRDQIAQWVYPLHRLDKPTSGVLLFALCPKVAAYMGEQFEHHKVQKTYQAITRGYVDDVGHIDYALRPIADFKSQKNKYKQKMAQQAISDYTCLATIELPFAVDKYPQTRYSWIELYPKTGRKHQLRRHMKHINHPIIGDHRFGKNKHNAFFVEHFGVSRLLLAATKIVFLHPVTAEYITIQAALKGDFERITQIFKHNQIDAE